MVWVLSLSDMDLSTHALTVIYHYIAFGFCQELVGGEAPASYQLLYLYRTNITLHLNAFRGVRAISESDWPFTPTHRSSQDFSTSTGSVLHLVLPKLQPVHG